MGAAGSVRAATSEFSGTVRTQNSGTVAVRKASSTPNSGGGPYGREI